MIKLTYNYAFLGYSDYYLLSLQQLAKDTDIVINCNPWESYGFILKIFCRLHFSTKIYKYVNLPFKSIWKRGICKARFSDSRPVCFILFGSNPNNYIKGLIPYIRKNYLNSSIVLHCTDKVDWYRKRFGNQSFDDVAAQVDLVVTYNPIDAEKYGYELFPPIVPDYSMYENTSNTKPSDILYVGRNKGRLDLLHKIYNQAKNNGLICDFTIIGVPENERLVDSDINYDKYIGYREVIDKINMTKAILNIPQNGACGLSLRDLEAVGNGKYLLTNNLSVNESPLFTENQCIMIDNEGNADYKQIRETLTLNLSEYKKYNWINRLAWIEKKLV